ncbi:hypothetical protein, partial [Mesorhizobium sp. B2-4-3]|uniref:hypothetical protein n=1 Tax=Mesorhizobium sp. B2-4-3 TaxID=2589946 RepID=UPI001AEF1EF7
SMPRSRSPLSLAAMKRANRARSMGRICRMVESKSLTAKMPPGFQHAAGLADGKLELGRHQILHNADDSK